MTTFEAIVEATAGDFERCVARHPLLARVYSGTADVSLYAGYLTELFHFVRHTSRALALAAARLNDADRDLREWLLEQARDEHGHELLCLKDLNALGYDEIKQTSGKAGPGAWALVTQNYFMGFHGNQVSLLGVASATEGLGAGMAENIAKTLIDRCGISKNAVSFLRSHSGFDQGHYKEAQKIINTVKSEEAIADIVHARRMTLLYYGQMLTDVLAATAAPSRAVAA